MLSLDPRVGDFEKADVLIDGKTIAQIAPTITASDAEIVDCTGTIVMPGFIHTHHHQYETLQRSIIPDGLLQGAWPQESYGSVVQNIWTAGRIADPANPNNIIWDFGRVPYDPEDCYISELLACLERNQRGHHHRNRYLAVLAHARTHRRDDQRFDGFRPAHGLRLLARHRSQQRWFSLTSFPAR